MLAGIICLGILAVAGFGFAFFLALEQNTMRGKINALQERMSDAQWREQHSKQRIVELEHLLKQQVQRSLAPEAEELAAWIEETESELGNGSQH